MNKLDITVRQIDLMKHAIGFSKNRVTGTKHRVMRAFRNHFCDKVNPDWQLLVENGFANKSKPNESGMIYYSVSLDGFKFLGDLCGLKIIETD